MSSSFVPAPVKADDAAQIVLNTIRRPVIMICPNNFITYANAEAEDFFRSSATVLARSELSKLLPFGSPILTLVEQVRERDTQVNEYRVDVSSPRLGIEKMVDNLYGKMFKTLMGEFGGQSDMMLSIKTGVESDQIAKLDEPTKGKVADMFDPHRKEREDQITRVIKPLISEALADMEPPMRSGLAKAYARKFTGAQLTDLNGFLASPTGRIYASEWMALQADPEVMLAVIKAVPPLITKFIDRAPEIEKDFKELPKEKQLSDFTDKDLAQLAKLMKVDVKVLKEQRDMWNSDSVEATEAAEAVDAAVDVAGAEAAADAAEAAADAAVAVEATEYDRSNWSEADRKRVEELEAAYLEAEAAAVEKARERLDKTPSE